jgi:pSer/pThr/pTyr-binding forkhead associated (FHA) protein
MPQEGETKTWLETKYGDQIVLQGICSIGRAESNNIIISKGSVSRHHAVIHEREKEYWIVDLGGVNGVLLNGNRVVQTARLNSGDVIGIPTTDFIFYHRAVTIEDPAPTVPKADVPLETAPTKEPAPVTAKTTPPSEIAPAKEPAPVVLKANPPLEGPMEAIPKPEPYLPPAETAVSAAVTIPLPNPLKASAQEELPLGLPLPSPGETGKLKKPRVYVGPVDTQGLPRPTTSQPLRPEAFKLTDTGAAKPFQTSSLPKPSADDFLKITTPLTPIPWVEKPKEIPQVNASDVIVPTVEKPKIPPARPAATVKADSFLQPSASQEAASATKSIKLLQKHKEAIPLSSVATTAPENLKEPPQLAKSPVPLMKSDGADKSDAESFILAPSSIKKPASSTSVPQLLLRDKPDEAKPSAPIQKVPGASTSSLTKAPSPLPAPSPVIDRLATPTKPADAKPSVPMPTAAGAPAASKPKDLKKPIQKAATSVVKAQAPATSKVVPPAGSPVSDSPAVQGAVCLAALHSMYIGLASIFLPFFGLITAPVAIFLGHSALKEIKQSRGALTGRQSAILGLYFGYISLALISSYSILLYLLFVAPGHSTSTPVSLALAPATFTTTNAPPMIVESTARPAPAASTPASAPSLDTAPPARIAPVPDATPPASPSANTPQTVISDSTGGNASTLLQGNSSPSPDTNAAPAAPSAPAAASTASTPDPLATVYDPNVLNRLKDGMLEQPMPEDTSSQSYSDAEAFNNCARLLARPPDPKYAESVGDFLDDVKKRNPDPARLQILSAMYENYMAGIKRDF